MSTFGDLLKTRRKALGLSVRAVQERTGLNYTFVSLMERGKRRPGRDTVQTLVEALGLSPSEAFEAAGFAPPAPYRLQAAMVPIYSDIPKDHELQGSAVPDGHGFLPEGEVGERLLYYLRVTGDSLLDRHIGPGDLVLIDASRHDADEGNLVAAQVGDEALLRFWHREDDHVVLRAANPDYPDIHAVGVYVLGVGLAHMGGL